ncbi:hydroxypyruvate reductase [Thecamonas trahens ATCC 50062]|uniref:Hydroxypyruvate reductase n=1 Tax=Thecamonas trahens ATCC 50062 TaxID=461836 RepID=A0A0L0DVG0_THETB|nr:hydroxypyruvate reductase [Thecamonas trahens ATCC 50062]KNC56299.1 hydroxypyruvate reductase [Thecamonas trahens ATCC 50062]|eukprot:XP_013760818.1 hydroxypyruvate reductase [Thecamonas trahens ATCC 50062]
MASVAASGSCRAQDVARRVFEAAVAAADPRQCVADALTVAGSVLSVARPLGGSAKEGEATAVSVDLAETGGVVLVGAGKAAVPMAAAVVEALGPALDHLGLPLSGHVVTKTGHFVGTSWEAVFADSPVAVVEASHPIPDAGSVAAADAIVAALKAAASASPPPLVINVLSGGASSLMESPAGPLSLDDVQATYEALIGCGASIDDINAVRKHLSAVKGGRLLEAAAPAAIVTLALSDVVGDALDVIGSGPTEEDTTSFDDARAVIARYNLANTLPPPVVAYLAAGSPANDTPSRASHPCLFAAATNVVVGSNALALAAAERTARELGFGVIVLSSRVEGEAAGVAPVYAALARSIVDSAAPIPAPAVVLAGGETTVTLGAAPGKGGRNQELALAAAVALDAQRPKLDPAAAARIAILAAGTDGTDGPTDAAGGLVSYATVAAGDAVLGQGAALAALRTHDAYPFLTAADALVVSGPTGTNVMDITAVVVA